jgi:hypothetical protein
MSAFTKVDIANACLGLMGIAKIALFAAGNPTADFCALNYEITVGELLSKHPWRFAMTQVRSGMHLT